MNSQLSIVFGGILGAVGVALGAMGAHALKTFLESHQLTHTYQAGVHYQELHSLALVAVGLLLTVRPSLAGQVAAWAFLVGILLFSGCIYGYVFSGSRWLVHMVPIGGVAFIVGWVALAVAGLGWKTVR